jgi:hypothetical protein
MIIYKADLIIDDAKYNEKEFLNNLEKKFESFYNNGISIHDANLYKNINGALNNAEIFQAVGVRISKYALNINQCKDLIINGSLNLKPIKIVYWFYNETNNNLEKVSC